LQVRVLQFSTLAPDQLLVKSVWPRASHDRLHETNSNLQGVVTYY